MVTVWYANPDDSRGTPIARASLRLKVVRRFQYHTYLVFQAKLTYIVPADLHHDGFQARLRFPISSREVCGKLGDCKMRYECEIEFRSDRHICVHASNSGQMPLSVLIDGFVPPKDLLAGRKLVRLEFLQRVECSAHSPKQISGSCYDQWGRQ